MVKYYTAIGRYELRRDESGFDAPVLIRARKEYQPGIGEMLLWTRLAWQIREVNDLKADFEKKRAELRVSENYSFEYYLRRLEDRGFIRSGKGYTAADALYALVAPLNLMPLRVSIFSRGLAFLKMVLLGRLPVGVALQVFAQPELSSDEKLAMQMLRRASFSTAELIACIDLKVTHIKDDDTIMKALYSEDCADVTCDDLPVYTRASAKVFDVLQTVIDLYTKKQILFDVY